MKSKILKIGAVVALYAAYIFVSWTIGARLHAANMRGELGVYELALFVGTSALTTALYIITLDRINFD